jgi:hypothetical protein
LDLQTAVKPSGSTSGLRQLRTLRRNGAHGRHSVEGGPRAAGRHRLILTRRITALARDPQNFRALFWNPAGASFEEAWRALRPPDGVLAVIGGSEVFGLFLEIGYESFHLSRASNVRLPGGRPLFPELRRDVTPEEMLARHGLKPGPQQVLDAAAGVKAGAIFCKSREGATATL